MTYSTDRFSEAAALAPRPSACVDPEPEPRPRAGNPAVARDRQLPVAAVPSLTHASDAAAAFDTFYADVARPLWGYLRTVSGDAATADDLLQESFLRLLTARGAPSDSTGRRRYLFRIAAHLLVDRGRRHQLAERHRQKMQWEEAPRERGASPEAPRDPLAAPFDLDLERALAELSPRERQLLWLAHVEEASHSEIAALAGLRPGSVKVLLFRARRKLGSLLRARGLAPQGDGP